MFNAIYIEIYKIFHKKNMYIFFGILAVFSILVVYVSRNAPGMDSAAMPLALLKAMFMLLLPIFSTVLLGEIFTGEIRSGTLKILLTRPLSRQHLFFSKLITLFILISILYAFVMICGFSLGIIFMGLPKASSLLTIFQTFFLSIFPMFAFSCLIVIFSLLTRKEGSLIGISLILMYASAVCGLVFQKVSPYLITSYFNVVDFLVKGPQVETKTVVIGWGVVMGYILLPSLLSWWLFMRKDIAG
jgi:ABC-2 type transport system permease protein